ncbi:MAG: RNA methyltransferase [Bdellovibrionales bacterium]|nr:RNA methyltransferase [Bdellovibrionales bacterium]
MKRGSKSPHHKNTARPSRGAKASALPPGGRWVIGWHSVMEALKVRPGAIAKLFLKSDAPKDPAVAQLDSMARSSGVSIDKHPAGFFDKLGGGHQGVACQVLESPQLDWEGLGERDTSILLVLDEIEDPHNLGAVMRSAWLMGADGILTPQIRTADVTPTVAKIASGGAEHIPVDPQSNLPRSLSILKEKGFWVFGLEEEGSTDLWETDFPPKIALVVGSEGRGIRSSVRGQCDQFVRIFQCETGASYNASVAAALALGEFRRQHKTP